jgi:3-deoxy-D-manno-octulosonic acid kinase
MTMVDQHNATGTGRRNTRTNPQTAHPSGFVTRVTDDTTFSVQEEYENVIPLREVLTGDPGPSRTGQTALPGGRGSTSIHVIAGIGDVVLRRYRRGGLIGKVLFDRYLCCSRPFRELAVLAHARSRGVPVPEIVGASSTRKGLLWHRGRIVTRLIPGSWTLPVFIGENRNAAALVADVLTRAGGAIRKMHEAGINHADLNMNNILVDGNGAVFIIDFDKAALHNRLRQKKRTRNLRRLLRSLRKLKSAGDSLEDSDFSMIIKGYAGSDTVLSASIERATLRSRLLMFRSALRRLLTELSGHNT